MTFKQMRDEITFMLGLQEIVSFNETAMIGPKLQQGTIDMLARTRCVARCIHIDTTKDVDKYVLDHEILALVDVENGRLPRGRRDQTDYSPSFSLIRSDVLRLLPPPDEDGELDVWAIVRPNLMTADADSPGDEPFGAIPDEFQDAIVTYALWKLSDYADEASMQQGERYRVLYEGMDGRGGRLAEIRKLVNKRGTARAPVRRLRMRGTLPRGAYVG